MQTAAWPLIMRSRLWTVASSGWLILAVVGCGGRGDTGGGNRIHNISGRVSGAVAAGVTVSLTGLSSAAVRTDSSGQYLFTGVVDGDHTVTPSLAGYTFSPASMTVTVNGANAVGRDFSASPDVLRTQSISGTVSGAVATGVTVSLTGTSSAAVTTDSSGHYTFTGVGDGDYTVAPSLAGYSFSPANMAVTVNGADAVGRDFTATADVSPAHRISGTVSGVAAAGVTMKLMGAGMLGPMISNTDSEGRYSFEGLADGAYTVKPMRIGYTFTPPVAEISMAGADARSRDFASAVAPGISLYGWVDGVTSAGVNVDLSGAVARSTTTDAFGDFVFEQVPDGGYMVAATSTTWSFVPAHYDLTTRGTNVVGLRFHSTPLSTPFSVNVAGDAASGVATGTYGGANNSSPNPDVAVYDPANDLWTLRFRFDAGNVIGLGGAVSIHGTPSEATYTEAAPGLVNTPGICWSAASEPDGNHDQVWVATSFTLTFSLVGAGVLTNVHGASTLSYLTYYPVHGTFHASCTPASNSSAKGTVTLDVAF